VLKGIHYTLREENGKKMDGLESEIINLSGKVSEKRS